MKFVLVMGSNLCEANTYRLADGNETKTYP